jgi:hypothetical protein
VKTVYETVTLIEKDLAAKLPDMLSAVSLPDFDRYGAGYPTDQDKKFCAVRFNSGSRSAGAATFTFTVQFQLPGIGEEDAYRYIDAASRYLSELETQEYGYYTGSFTVEMLENFRVSDTEVFFDYTMTGVMDDC